MLLEVDVRTCLPEAAPAEPSNVRGAPVCANGLAVPPLPVRLPALSLTAATAADDDESGLAVIAALPFPMTAITPTSSSLLPSPPTAWKEINKTFLKKQFKRQWV